MLAALVALLGSACQRQEPPVTASPPAESPPPAAESPSPTPSPSPPAGTAVRAADSSLGRILVDEGGRTLYVFMNDSPGESTCYDACAQRWPALLTQGAPRAGEGADGSLLGTAQRRDGGSQVAYNGQPLYHFSGDQAPGQTNGQGVGGVWFVVSPAGQPVR